MSFSRTHSRVWCPRCKRLVPPVGPDNSAVVLCGVCKTEVGVWCAGLPALLPMPKQTRPAATGRSRGTKC